MPDGTVLRADAWTPDESGRWPVLLQRLPYGRSVASTPALPHPEQLARHGYAVVVQDVRGRGDSDGVFEPFVDDGPDGAATIEWAARLPFCDGQVATYGFSYQGFNQLAAAANRPPSLRAIAPMMCAPEAFEGWTYEGGCLRWPFVTSWAAQLAAQEPAATPITPDLEALPPVAALGPQPPLWFREWLGHPDDDSYWRRRRPDLSAINVPAFTVLGYFDDFAAGTARLFELLGAEGVCGPWGHMPWGTRLGDVELGPASSPAIAHDALLRFFDRVLKRGGARHPPVVRYFDGASWRTSDTWPPPHASHTWSAASGGNANSRHGDGRLQAGPGTELDDLFVSQPLVPYPGTLGPLSDEAAAEDRRDVLSYTTDRFADYTTIAGSADIRARVAADTDSHDLIVSAVVVSVAGTPRRLTTGARRVTAPADVDGDVEVQLSPLAWTFAPGERLRVDVSASRFPAFDRNPQSRATPSACTPRSGCRVATIHLRRLEIDLPIVTERAEPSSPGPTNDCYNIHGCDVPTTGTSTLDQRLDGELGPTESTGGSS